MNPVYPSFMQTHLGHRTIREFTHEEVDEQTIDLLGDLCNRTASSTGIQQAGWIRITDPELKGQIAEVCKQEYVARAPELWIFIVDCYRNKRLVEAHGGDASAAGDMNHFTQGFTDAVLMAQSLTTGVEQLGMGAVFLGSILNNPRVICDLLALPELTFPVLGVGFGYPNQEPLVKPRMPKELRSYENSYKPSANYAEDFADYDEQMLQYYDLRDLNHKTETFSSQVQKRVETVDARRAGILQDIAAQGFLLQIS